MAWHNSKKNIQNHLISLTKEMVSFPSHSEEPLKILELMEYIQAYFKNKKVFFHPFTSCGYPSLVLTLQETKHPDILLSGHVDVVPSSNRYSAVEKDKFLYGSGALDMKGGIAVMMSLMDYFSEEKSPPSLGLMITSDEEIGSFNGTKMLLEKEGYRANFVVINEGRKNYDLVVREKGILNLKLVCKGKYIHSAYPWLGTNSIEELMRVVNLIKKKFPKPTDEWAPTCTLTVVRAGQEENTIPGEAYAVLNIRLTGGTLWTKEKVLKKIHALLPENIEILETEYADIFEVDPKHPQVQLLKRSAEEVLGKPMRLSENHGSSDAKVFMKYGIPTVILGPSGKDHHSPNEALEIESLLTHFEVLKKFIEKDCALKTNSATH